MGTQIIENSPRQFDKLIASHALTDIRNYNCNLNSLILGLIFMLFNISVSAQRDYKKTYFDDGTLKEEGWQENNQKTGYWKFYHPNGKIAKEGHYKNDQASKYWYFYRADGTKESEGHYENGFKSMWWLFYDDMEIINHKCQLKNNLKNGYCLMYKNRKIISARKYKAGKQIKEWTNLKAFRKENNLRDLQ